MAFRGGTQIRPELGRVDWSPIERGGRAIGQGIAQAGQAFATAIQQNRQRKEQKMREEQAVQFGMSMFPDMSKEDVKAGVKGVGADNFLQVAGMAQGLKQRAEQQRVQTVINDLANMYALGEEPDVTGIPIGIVRESKIKGRKIAKDISTGKGAVMSLEDMREQYPVESVQFTPLPDGNVRITNVSKTAIKPEKEDERLVISQSEYDKLLQQKPASEGWRITAVPLAEDKYRITNITKGKSDSTESELLKFLGGSEPDRTTPTTPTVAPSLF